MSFVSAFQKAGIVLSDAAIEALAAIEAANGTIEMSQAEKQAKAEAEARTLARIAESITAICEEEKYLLSSGLTVGIVDDKVVVSTIPANAKSKGSGNGAFGGGGGSKVKGPFRDTKTGAVYAGWHEVAVAVLAHKCKAGEKSKTSKCGYWTKALVELRDSKRFWPVSSAVSAPVEPVAEPVAEPVVEPAPAPKTKKKKHG